MSSRRQRSIPLGGRYRQVSLYVWNKDTHKECYKQIVYITRNLSYFYKPPIHKFVAVPGNLLVTARVQKTEPYLPGEGKVS